VFIERRLSLPVLSKKLPYLPIESLFHDKKLSNSSEKIPTSKKLNLTENKKNKSVKATLYQQKSCENYKEVYLLNFHFSALNKEFSLDFLRNQAFLD
jgi:hypothetical protein